MKQAGLLTIVTTGLFLLSIIAGCGSTTSTLGEKIIKQGQDMAGIGKQWVEGEKMIKKGERMISDGEDKIAEGKRLMKRGQEMMQESEQLYKQRGGQGSLQ